MTETPAAHTPPNAVGGAAAYDYALAVGAGEGRGDLLPLSLDAEPALEHARFEGIRRGVLPPVLTADGHLEPCWADDPPRLAGLRAVVRDAQGRAHSVPIAPALLVGAADEALSRADPARIAPGARFAFVAHPRSGAHAGVAPTFRVRSRPQPLPLRGGSLAAYHARALSPAEPRAVDLVDSAFPVFFRPEVLVEARAQAEAAEGVETGGVLLGRLLRDDASPEVFAEVTALVPARHTDAGQTWLRLTAATWTDVQAALAGRPGALALGWFHSHPFLDALVDREPERAHEAPCAFATGFFSAADRTVHRTAFPRAFGLALVVTLTRCCAPHVSEALFGWWGGSIARRSFLVLGAEGARARQ